jgi:predicted RNA-binding protein associated with RNAse of E/G family
VRDDGGATIRFAVGQTAVRRCHLRDGRLVAVEAGRVIADDEGGLMLWVASGSTVVRRTTIDGISVRKMSMPTILRARGWEGGGVLILTPPRAAHSIWWFFDEDGQFRRWYINLEAPAVRWSGGVDLEDHALDIWISRDRSWQWKDEDELAERTGHPSYWDASEVPAIWAEGKRVIALAEAGVYPFDGTWVDFTPDPDWTPTTLPSDWDLPR